jgi:hypothetical protein
MLATVVIFLLSVLFTSQVVLGAGVGESKGSLDPIATTAVSVGSCAVLGIIFWGMRRMLKQDQQAATA